MEFIRQCPICGSDHVDRRRGGFMVCRSCDNLFFCKNREKNPADFYQNAARCVFEVCLTAEDKERCGTATLISEKGCLITSAHLFLDQSEEHNRLYPLQNITSIRRGDNGEAITAKVLRLDFQTDLALLSVPSLAGVSPIPLSYRKVYTGQKICVIGNSLGEGLCMVDGLVSDSHREMDGRDLFMISAPVTTGCSGGPVLDSSGCLVGMVTCGRKGETCMNYAVSGKVICDFIRDKL